jgi:hypothetical protein
VILGLILPPAVYLTNEINCLLLFYYRINAISKYFKNPSESRPKSNPSRMPRDLPGNDSGASFANTVPNQVARREV